MGHPAAIAERACVGPGAEAKTSTVVPRSAAYYSLDGLATLILVAGILIAIAVQRPSAKTPRNPADLLSYDRALADVRQVAALPHPTGSTANQAVASYIIQQLDAMGVQHRIQDGLSVERGDSNRFRAVHLQNLIATVPGGQSTGSILLMAHYDSVPTSSGAADDASGVAALLETLRVVLRMGPLRNDLVVLFTDGEELGLLGSRVFLRDDPVARSVRIVVNFEARGSGGPSVMFESGDSSDWLVRDFAHWSPHPYTNSLTSAIYKLLPNDTDFTPFRSRGTPGLNLAFIDDPANYHSALDTADRLSSASLEQQLENAQTLALQLGIMDM